LKPIYILNFLTDFDRMPPPEHDFRQDPMAARESEWIAAALSEDGNGVKHFSFPTFMKNFLLENDGAVFRWFISAGCCYLNFSSYLCNCRQASKTAAPHFNILDFELSTLCPPDAIAYSR
jgi:hypothetical protein